MHSSHEMSSFIFSKKKKKKKKKMKKKINIIKNILTLAMLNKIKMPHPFLIVS